MDNMQRHKLFLKEPIDAKDAENERFVAALARSRWKLDEAIAWISTHLKPKDVFPKSALADWATEHGYEEAKR